MGHVWTGLDAGLDMVEPAANQAGIHADGGAAGGASRGGALSRRDGGEDSGRLRALLSGGSGETNWLTRIFQLEPEKLVCLMENVSNGREWRCGGGGR